MKEKTPTKRKGYLREPLFKFIEFQKTVVDPLHMMLRVSDKLFEILLFRLQELDKKQVTYKAGDLSTCFFIVSFFRLFKRRKNGLQLNSSILYS